jgi:quinoprotein glucose dehydrogenase
VTPIALVLAFLSTNAHSTPTRITPGNVSHLTVAWTYDTHDPTTPFRPGGKQPAFEATPAYADGQLYLSTLRHAGAFTPPSLGGSLLVPGNIGGPHWGGIAWDAKHRLLIAPVNRLPTVARLIPRAQYDAAKKAFPSRETTEQDGTPYSMSRELFVGPHGTPCVAPPWGELVAVRADDGEIAWRVPLGDLRETRSGSLRIAGRGSASAPAQDSAPPAAAGAAPAGAAGGDTAGAKAPSGSPNLGGPATTDTGLVFIGATLDGMFRAFDTRTGRELWKAKLPTSARATPLIYVTPKGRQMIAIAAGGHDSPLSHIDTKLVVFALK